VNQQHLKLNLFVPYNVYQEIKVCKKEEQDSIGFLLTNSMKIIYLLPIISARIQPTDHISIGL